ncbi:unnamed protein product [Paramecium primaurelia]|uniref:Acetyl-CoA transporter n=1 Tax=Paramecium primaurelia TaxID=5886 RepID=A0A8S1JR75_PARPR|nr:unnamed protein product [Paramecium primaurelia]
MTKISSKDKNTFILFIFLYFVQGIPLGLWSSTLMMILLEHGVPYSNLAILSLAIYPFSFKMLTAPFLDVYYIKSIGKRRTYIIPIQYLMAIIYTLLYFTKISTWVYNIEFLTIIGFILILLSAHQDIAIDGWVLTAFSSEHNHLGATAQTVGQMIGVIFSTTIFITLNSKDFCNSYIYTLPQETGILSLDLFCLINALYLIALTLYVQFCTKEQSKEESIDEIEQHQIKTVFRNLKELVLNRNLQFLFLHLILFRLCFQPILTSTSSLLIAQGLKKEVMAWIQTIMIPINFIIIALIGKYDKRGNELQKFFHYLIFRIGEAILTYSIFKLFPDILSYESIYQYLYLIFFGITQSLLSNSIFINHGTLFNRISDPQVGATSLTLINSIHNLGGAITESLSILSLSLLSYDIVALLTVCFGLSYYLILKKPLIKLTEQNQKVWQIKKKQSD